MALTRKDIENNLAFLERCQLTGKEAEAMVQLRYKLIAEREELLRAEVAKPPPKPPAKPPGNGKKGKE